jgi:hypothetical protein
LRPPRHARAWPGYPRLPSSPVFKSWMAGPSPAMTRKAWHKAPEDVPDGDRFLFVRPCALGQAIDPARVSALLTESGTRTYPHLPRLPHPCPTFCPLEASSGGAGDGAEGRFPCVAALPAKAQGRRRETRPFGPFVRHCAGGDRCARSIARRAMRNRRDGAQPRPPDGTGAMSPHVPQRRGFQTGAAFPRRPWPGRRGSRLLPAAPPPVLRPASADPDDDKCRGEAP